MPTIELIAEVKWLNEKVSELQAENERLKKQVLVWHKWPGEKPDNSCEKRIAVGKDGVEYFFTSRPKYWGNNSFYWAKIPKPEVD